MKIIKENAVMFRDVSIGDVFCHNDRPYLKTEAHHDNDDEKEINAVDLEGGLFILFSDNANVFPVMATLKLVFDWR